MEGGYFVGSKIGRCKDVFIFGVTDIGGLG